ncbi:MAG: peptidyl-alpha-hydroxyglycine alpha-amidating lyase family protein [Dehalococcoidia bacterium]
MLQAVTPDTKYEPVPFWAKVPHGLWLREATSVAVDSEDRVYVFNRGNMPVLVFDRDGNMIHMWGNDNPFAGMHDFVDPYGNTHKIWQGCQYTWAHSVRADHEDNIWLVDTAGHRAYKTDTKGTKTQLQLGTGAPAVRQSGEMFNRPTDIAIHPKSGDLFVSDGYGNSRIHRLDKAGNHILSWGQPGADAGDFSLPHNIAILDDNHVVVCDRENHRVQVFTIDGAFVREWHVHKAVAVWVDRANRCVYVAEQGPPPVQFGVRNLGHRVSIYTPEGQLLNRIGNALPGEAPDQFLWPHSVAVDSQGSIYVADVSYVEVGSRQTPPREMVSLHKWRRVRG